MPGSVLVVLRLHLLEYSHPVLDIGLTVSRVLGMRSEAGKALRLPKVIRSWWRNPQGDEFLAERILRHLDWT